MDQETNTFKKKPLMPFKSHVLILSLTLFLLICFFIQTIYDKHKSNSLSTTIQLPKPTPQPINHTPTEPKNDWITVKPRPGDSLASVFKRLGLHRQVLQTILKNNPYAKQLAQIKPNQNIQFLIRHETLEMLILPISIAEDLIVSHEKHHYTSKIKTRKTTQQKDYITATVHGSLYSTAKRNNIPSKLIQQMTTIFNWEIDFAREVRSGDQFSIVYEANYIQDKLVNTGEILAVIYTNQGKTYHAIRHINASGDSDYFNQQGISLQKAFSRYPIKFSHISSTYSLSRYHPVLHYRRPHKGVDLAASIGTPIHATGDGRIIMIQHHQGYGNMIKIAHNKTYTSLYAHMLRFQKGLSKGSYVKRGQVIGYVGQTGLADGPHCHYEFHINHQPRNPSTIELPRSSPISSRKMLAFQTKANALLAQLKLFETAHLAANNISPRRKLS